MYIVKPIYFKKDNVTVNRIINVYDTNCPEFDADVGKFTHEAKPNFIIAQNSQDLMEDIKSYFSSIGVPTMGWRIAPPSHVHYTFFDEYLHGVDVVRAS